MEAVAVAAGPVLILGLLLYINARRNVEDIKKDWVQYRCHPGYMPFVSMFTDETTTSENFQYCTNAFAKEVFSRATDPIYRLFGMFGDIVGSLVGDMNHFLTYLAGMDKFIFSFANTVFGKLFNTMGAFTQQIGAVRDIVNRIGSSAYYAAFIAQTLVDFVMAMFNFMMTLVKTVVIMVFALGILVSLFYPAVLAFFLPLGTLFGLTFFCFDPATLVDTDRGQIPIAAVQLGDTIGRSRVTAKFVLDCPPAVELFVYNGIIVSGEHIVYHGGRWMPVRDTGVAPYKGVRPTHLICLNMTNNIIQIRRTYFRDYEETDDPDALISIEKIVWGRRKNINYPLGLHPQTLVTMADGTLRPINQIRLGDVLLEGRVTGVVELDAREIVWYDVEGCVVSGCQPVCKEIRALASEVGTRVSSPPSKAYSLFLDNATGWFMIHDKLLVRDYPDSHNPVVLDAIQEIVMRALKK